MIHPLQPGSQGGSREEIRTGMGLAAQAPASCALRPCLQPSQAASLTSAVSKLGCSGPFALTPQQGGSQWQ